MAKQQPKTKEGDPKGNIYDRIFRENAQHVFVPLIEWKLGLEIESYQALPEKMPKTLERELDFLYKVKTKDQKELLLHIEFQTKDDKDMVFRMQEYHSLIFRKYRLPIEPIVVYLGKGASKMRKKLEDWEVFKGFELINLSEVDVEYLLNSQRPEAVILALLSDYKTASLEEILHSIVQRLGELSDGNISSKYLTQLQLLSRIRNLHDQISNILEDMPIQYDVYKDSFFLKGLAQGMEQGMKEGIEKGLAQGVIKGEDRQKKLAEKRENETVIRLYEYAIPMEKIGEAMNIPLERIKKVIAQWEKDKAAGKLNSGNHWPLNS